MLKIRKISLVTIVLIMFSIGSVVGQRAPIQQQQAGVQETAELSDEELRKFVGAFIEIRDVDRQAQERMNKKIAAEGLDVNRFNEVQQAIHNPNIEPDADEKELAKVEKAGQKVTEIRINAQREMQQKIRKNGLSLERYQEISMIIQGDSEVERQFNQLYHEITNSN